MWLLLASGAAGLIYQVLWMKQLGLLFGNTAQASSTTLAAFFAGLAIGSWWWGGRVSRSANPLRTYARLELGIAITALIYYFILGLFYWVYTAAYQATANDMALLAIKFAMAVVLIFPPAFFMGGTLPAMGQYLIRRSTQFGRTSAALYGANTLGAAIGVVAAAFVLVPTLGFSLTYAAAIAISLGVGLTTWRMSANAGPSAFEPLADEEPHLPASHGLHPMMIGLLCFASGFGVLALEVLWTRMFAQVHENSVYAFAVMLAVALGGLAIGAWISSLLARLNRSPVKILAVLFTLAGGALVAGPTLFMTATDDMQTVSSLESWPAYVGRVFGMGIGGIGAVVVALGTIFPFIMKVQERRRGKPGQSLGKLLAINTFGSILGALVCGFVLLPRLGMWRSMLWITAGYLALGVLVPRGRRATAVLCRGACLGLGVLLFTRADPSALPATGASPQQADESVIETWEGSDCTVSVVQKPWASVALKINSGYTLGSTGAYYDQINQSHVPLNVFRNTRRLFFLGVGTGISVGAAIDPRFKNVQGVVACELVPEVIEAAKKYIPAHMTGGAFTDPRVRIRLEDGRQYLRVCDEHFDMINADLFLPYRRGAGSLYSLDHYRAAKRKLTPRGVYVQWLPLFQLTESEFGIIARTMLEAFDQVTLWRGNFDPGHEIVALVGQVEARPILASPHSTKRQMLEAVAQLDWQTVRPDLAAPEAPTITFFYGGNLTAARKLFEQYSINTDDRPLIEYQTPRTFRDRGDDPIIWFVGPRIADLIDAIFERCPLDADPALANRTPANRRLALAGAAFHRAMVYKALRQNNDSRAWWQVFLHEWQLGAD